MLFQSSLFWNRPTPLLDYGLIVSTVSLAAALCSADHSCALSGGALLCNLATLFVVYYRSNAHLPQDTLQGFPLYDIGGIFFATLMTIADSVPALFIALSTWLSSSLCWWIACTTWVVTIFGLLECLEEGTDRIRAAERNFKDGWTWQVNRWQHPPVAPREPKHNKKTT